MPCVLVALPTHAQIAANAVIGTGAMQGQFFLFGPGGAEENATECIQHLLAHMPRRDLLLLFSEPFRFVDFIIETVRTHEAYLPTTRARPSCPLYARPCAPCRAQCRIDSPTTHSCYPVD